MVPRVYTHKEFEESKKCVGSMGSFLDLMKLGAHCQSRVVGRLYFRVKNTLQLQYSLRHDFSAIK